jgi:hypothetical protein
MDRIGQLGFYLRVETGYGEQCSRMYLGMEGKGAEDGDRREENEYLLGDAPVRVCWWRERG